MMTSSHSDAAADRLAQRLAFHYKIITVGWIILSVLLLFSGVFILAAIWNGYVLWQRRHVPRLLANRSPAVVQMYQNDEVWFLIFFVINLVLGGGFGALLIAYEFFFVRAQVRKNQALFTAAPGRAAY